MLQIRRGCTQAALVAAALLAAACGAVGGGPCFSQLQMLSSHNSYHLAPSPAINQLLTSPLAQSLLPPELFLPQAWQYSHRPLAEQLDEGVRSLELDVHGDPEGGRYAQSAGLRLAGQSGVLDVPALRQPGFKVFHLPDFDFNSTCFLLTDCLAEVRRWSERNPGHLPIVIFIETKQPDDVAAALGPETVATIEAMLAASPLPGPDSLTPSLELNASGLAALEGEIRSVFDAGSLLTPGDVAALLAEGDRDARLDDVAEHLLAPPSNESCPWPDLDAMRDKVLFALILGGEEQAMISEELHPSGSLDGTLFWPVSSQGFEAPWPAVLYNAALSLGPEEAKAAGAPPGELPSNISAYIDEWVEEANVRASEGYIVRARADQDTVEARHNFTARRDALLASGAQLIQTDYAFHPSAIFPSTYQVSLPGGRPARCVNGGSGSQAPDIACG